jgi:hypothetical protein
MKTKIWTIILLFANLITAIAQPVEMADSLRADGKIYVVVAVLLIIMLGLFYYLYTLDRKISKLEK